MRITSIIVLAFAVCLGIVAVIGVRGLIAQNQRIVAPVTSTIVEGTIVVARQPMNFGTEIEAELLKEIPWSSPERPVDAFSTIDEILSGERRVALRSISPGELILKDRISGFGGRATLSQIIGSGKRAVTLRVNDVSGAAGFILPGDRVDVLSTIQPTDERIDTLTNILLEDVRVIAIDQLADESQEGAVVAKSATLEVEPEDAQKLALASTIGTLSLTLRNLSAAGEDGESDIASNKRNRTIGYRDLGPQRSTNVTRSAAPSPFTSMRVVRGTAASNASVLRDRTPVNRTSSIQPGRQNPPLTSTAATDLAQTTATRLTAPTGE